MVVYLHFAHVTPNIYSNFSEYHLTYEVITSEYFPETKDNHHSLQTVPQRQFILHFSLSGTLVEKQP